MNILNLILPYLELPLCTNLECLSNKDDDKREIIPVRYDDDKLKYVYLCAVCDNVWKLIKLIFQITQSPVFYATIWYRPFHNKWQHFLF